MQADEKVEELHLAIWKRATFWDNAAMKNFALGHVNFLLAVHIIYVWRDIMNNFVYEIKQLPAFRAMGLKCDVPFTEIETITDVIQSSIRRVDEFEYAVNKDVRLGLSYHLRPDGFVYYSAYEVSDEQQVLEDMVEINVPEMTYLVTKHTGGSIEETYGRIMDWINGSDYIPFKEQGVKYYDELPIKHEIHPSDSVTSDPHFDILIPIEKP